MSVRRLLTAAPAALLGVLALAAPAAAQVSIAEEDGGGQGPGRAFAAVGLALVGAVLGVVALADSDADVGTGNGQGGAIVAVVLALVGLAVGGLALARSRRTA